MEHRDRGRAHPPLPKPREDPSPGPEPRQPRPGLRHWAWHPAGPCGWSRLLEDALPDSATQDCKLGAWLGRMSELLHVLQTFPSHDHHYSSGIQATLQMHDEVKCCVDGPILVCVSRQRAWFWYPAGRSSTRWWPWEQERPCSCWTPGRRSHRRSTQSMAIPWPASMPLTPMLHLGWSARTGRCMMEATRWAQFLWSCVFGSYISDFSMVSFLLHLYVRVD